MKKTDHNPLFSRFPSLLAFSTCVLSLKIFLYRILLKKEILQIPMLTIACWGFLPTTGYNQCQPFQINHLSGTQTVGCVDVTVTPDGSTLFGFACGYGPYGIGNTAPGSFTFSFSSPVSEVRIGFGSLDYSPANSEELSFEVNGVFYPITIPGNADGCQDPASISPTGTIWGNGNDLSSWQNVVITGSINTLKIEDLWITGTPMGVGVEVAFCCSSCTTEAGVISSANTSPCSNESLQFNSTGDVLDPDDALEFILFSNPSDTLGSILLTSSTTSFVFSDPPLQTGVTYYIIGVAGNELPGGGVDLTDLCLDFTNVLEVSWKPLPSVTFTVSNPDICQGDCTNVEVTLTGTPPFDLTYDTQPGNSGQTATFPGTTGTLEVCVPGTAPPGSFSLQAVSLTDANCTCE